MAPGGFPNKDLTRPSRTLSPLCSTTRQEMHELVAVRGVMRIKLRATALAPRQAPMAAVAEAKARQSSKIRELRIALRSAGLIGLDEQAKALGLPRSTTWKILKGEHKTSGLSAMVISRMLSAPRLPPVVRTKILEYVREKTDGLYGHGKRELLRFSARIRYTNAARNMWRSR